MSVDTMSREELLKCLEKTELENAELRQEIEELKSRHAASDLQGITQEESARRLKETSRSCVAMQRKTEEACWILEEETRQACSQMLKETHREIDLCWSKLSSQVSRNFREQTAVNMD